MKHSIRPLLAPVLLAGAALFSLPAAAQAPATAEARIPSAAMVSTFRIDGPGAIYLRAGGHWYRGAFAAPCRELASTRKLRFDTGADRAVDRDAVIRAGGAQCRLNSLVMHAGDPPATARKPRGTSLVFSGATKTYLRSRKVTL